MSLVSDYKTLYRLARARAATTEQRSFAILQMVLQPVSFLTILLVIVRVACRCFGISLPLPAGLEHWGIPILVAGAVGYLTNWVAIEMLFKPYAPTWRHGFAWITLGYWKQGLVPKNKAKIAKVMGNEVASRLLQPEKLANDLCDMAGGILGDQNILASIQTVLQEQITRHDREIADFLAPRIEEALAGEIDRLVTAENVESFWSDEIEPRLASRETREEVAAFLVAALDKRAPQVAKKARPMLVRSIENWVEDKGGMLGSLLSPLAGALADAIIDRKTIERALREWLEDPQTVPVLRDELIHFVKAVREFLVQPETKTRVGGFVADIRTRFKDYLRNYLRNNLPATVGGILRSEQLWQWASTLLPRFQPDLERLIRERGMPLIIEKLNVEGRIQSAVDGMDMAEFHGMINDVAAQHLGAIQVLGYFLGAVAGALTLFV